MEKKILSPSLLSADFSNLKSAVQKIEKAGNCYVHIDVMDGCFVPQISFGQPVVFSLRPLTNLPFDVHLMTQKPETQFESFVKAGANIITFHIEAAVHAYRFISQLHDLKVKAGVAICPSTPVSAIKEILDIVDLVLVMTVNPGFGGQSLISQELEKVRKLCKLRKKNNFKYLISVDGGVNKETLPSVLDSGADIIVSGSAFFNGGLGW